MSQYKVDSLKGVQRFVVYTMTDKERRNRMFEEFRRSDDAQERQAVKFSGAEIVLDNSGKLCYAISGLTVSQSELMLSVENKMDPNTTKELAKMLRPVYRSTWSVAYPSGKVN